MQETWRKNLVEDLATRLLKVTSSDGRVTFKCLGRIWNLKSERKNSRVFARNQHLSLIPKKEKRKTGNVWLLYRFAVSFSSFLISVIPQSSFSIIEIDAENDAIVTSNSRRWFIALTNLRRYGINKVSIFPKDKISRRLECPDWRRAKQLIPLYFRIIAEKLR